MIIIIMLSLIIGMILGMNLQEPKECNYGTYKERLETISGKPLSLSSNESCTTQLCRVSAL